MILVMVLLALAVMIVAAWPDSFESDLDDSDDWYLDDYTDDVEDDDAKI